MTARNKIGDFFRFYSRLPVPAARGGGAMPDFAQSAWGAPVAGAIIGACGAVALMTARLLGAAPAPAAVCAVAALVFVTGALHEDGLADVADGFGGGATRGRKLEIMRDSSLGTYGVCALALTLLLRVSALAAIIENGAVVAAFALVAAGAVSRAAALLPMTVLPPARADGSGASAQTPGREAFWRALAVGALFSLAPVFAGALFSHALGADVAALGAAMLVTSLARRQIGGYTGDVLGAAQQAAEMAALLALSAR